MKLRYSAERLPGGWKMINVLEDSTVVGRISQGGPKNTYRFFPGADNAMAYIFEHAALKELKVMIEGMDWRARQRPRRP